MDLQYHHGNGIEFDLDVEFWPVEHPMEPPDEDRPVKCPIPTASSVINVCEIVFHLKIFMLLFSRSCHRIISLQLDSVWFRGNEQGIILSFYFPPPLPLLHFPKTFVF